MRSYLLNITLNINGLNFPTRRQRLAKWIQKQNPYIWLSTKDPPQTQGNIQTESKGLEKIFHANGDQKKAGVVILISDKIEFEIKATKRDKEGHYIMIKESIQEENTTIINIYAPNIGTLTM